jgi:hypothetical protein
VSSGDEGLLRFHERESWHFPGDEEGHYLGYHPGDDDEALRHLAAARNAGAQFLAFPESTCWWLSAYPRLASHLRSLHRIAVEQEQVGVIFQLVKDPGERALNQKRSVELSSDS